MAKLTFMSLLAISLVFQRPVSAVWEFEIFTVDTGCTGPSVVLDGDGPQGCANLAEEVISFIFTSSGEELELFFEPNCGIENSKQVFPGSGTCFSVIIGGSIANSFDVIDGDLSKIAGNFAENYAPANKTS